MAEHTVLIAGATGMLGERIARALLNKTGVTVKLLVRKASLDNGEKQTRVRELQDSGAIITEGDLADMTSLQNACRGVTAIVSAVQGGEEIIVQGQRNLLQAASEAHVQRFIPSDYSFDYFKLAEGDNYNADLRRHFAGILKGSGVPYTFVLNGAFTEVELSPWGLLIDEQNKTFSYWGNGEMAFDITTIDDAARYTAEAVLDAGKANQPLQVAGEVLTMKEFLTSYQDATGEKLCEQRMGTVEELKAWIEEKKQSGAAVNEYLAQQYHYGMVSGKGKLDYLENERYPQIQPLTLRQYLEKTRGS